MAETPAPLECWALVEDEGGWDGREVRRIHGVYLNSRDAIDDSGALQPAHFVDVVPFPIHRAPQWSSHHEPALEQTDEDFDVPLDIPGL